MNLTAIDLDIMLKRVGVADALEYLASDHADARAMRRTTESRGPNWRPCPDGHVFCGNVCEQR